MKKALLALTAVTALASCAPAEDSSYRDATPRDVETRVGAPSVSDRTTVSVTVYNDPGGCQYLIVRGYDDGASITPRIQQGTNGVCFPAER